MVVRIIDHFQWRTAKRHRVQREATAEVKRWDWLLRNGVVPC